MPAARTAAVDTSPNAAPMHVARTRCAGRGRVFLEVHAVVLAIGLWLLPAAALPATDAPEVQAFRDWALRCPSAGTCLLEQRIFVEGGKSPLMRLSLLFAGPGQRLMAAVRVPLDVVLPQGLALAVDDGAPQKVPFHHCRSDGCYAIFPVPERLLGQLRAGLNATLSVERLDGNRLSVPASLLGITAGLKALREAR